MNFNALLTAEEMEVLEEGIEYVNTLEEFYNSGEFISAWFSPSRES